MTTTPPQKEAPVGEQQEYRALSREELDELAGEALPERAAMSLINANIAAPVNLAAALNVLSDNSTAIAVADQTAPINQSIEEDRWPITRRTGSCRAKSSTSWRGRPSPSGQRCR
jgi:hypothetical protein